MIVGKRLGRLVGLLVLGLFALCTGCPGDHQCPDCHVKARSATSCGELVFTGTVPGEGQSFTSPKLVVLPATGSEQTLPLASPANPEPWKSSTQFSIELEPSDLPTMCDSATERAPHGAWHTATVRLSLEDSSGQVTRWKVQNDLPPPQ